MLLSSRLGACCLTILIYTFLGWRYNLRPTQRTLRLCRCPYGCVQSHDKSLAGRFSTI